MNDTLELILWTVLSSTVLVAYGIGVLSCLRAFLRNLRTDSESEESERVGKSIDSKAIAMHVRHLRQNHLTGLVLRGNDKLQRKARVVSARRTVIARSYFRHRQAECPEQDAQGSVQPRNTRPLVLFPPGSSGRKSVPSERPK